MQKNRILGNTQKIIKKIPSPTKIFYCCLNLRHTDFQESGPVPKFGGGRGGLSFLCCDSARNCLHRIAKPVWLC